MTYLSLLQNLSALLFKLLLLSSLLLQLLLKLFLPALFLLQSAYTHSRVLEATIAYTTLICTFYYYYYYSKQIITETQSTPCVPQNKSMISFR